MDLYREDKAQTFLGAYMKGKRQQTQAEIRKVLIAYCGKNTHQGKVENTETGAQRDCGISILENIQKSKGEP